MSVRRGPAPTQPAAIAQPAINHADRLKALQSFAPQAKTEPTGVSTRLLGRVAPGADYGAVYLFFKIQEELNAWLREKLGYVGDKELRVRPRAEDPNGFEGVFWETPGPPGTLSGSGTQLEWNKPFIIRAGGGKPVTITPRLNYDTLDVDFKMAYPYK